jgi:WD40 repeat protein
LKARVYTPQYWVIDALDECSKYPELFTMLKGESPEFPLRIFMTSRVIGDMQRLQRSIESSASLVCIEIPIQASLADIQRYVRSRIDGLPVDSAAEREELANTILRKSNGCFLWVRLVMDELENVYSNESIITVLERIPEGMRSYYERTINTMTAITLDKHIAKAVLMWAATSARRLTTAELSQALKLDINAVLPSAKSAVEGLCGQLVAIDRDTDLIDLIHPTAREFLVSEAAGEFAVSKLLAHERISLACLQLLSSNEMRPPRNKRLLAQARPLASPFLDYALTQFSEHIASASSGNDKLLIAIDHFLRTNALSWIEKLAVKGNLHSLIRASKNLKSYLDRRAKYQSPLNSQVRNIDAWSADLSRLVTRFGEALLQNPSSIYFLVPPLCPSGSALYQQFGKRPDGLAVLGKTSSAWDDCIAHVSFGDDGAVAVSCGDSLIAVGMAWGDVNLYDHRSCQKQAVIRNKYPIYLVHLMDNGIVSCTSRSITLQDLAGNIIWEQRLRFQCLYLTASDHCIVAVSQHAHLLRWDKSSGALLEDQVFEYRNHDADTQHNGLVSRVPHVVSISPDMEMLALGYRGGAVCLWEITGPEFIDWARDEKGRQAAAVLFNPNPNINLLLVIYTDHSMALFDTWSGTLVHAQDMPQQVGLLSASCSPDGRTLVTTDTLSNMRIWDFESLALLYHVVSHFPGFRILNFSSDGSSIIDVMDSGMRIWSPAVLIRKLTEEDASVSDEAIHLAVTEGEAEPRKGKQIRALSPHPSAPVAVAGKYNGQVVVFSGKGERELYSHGQGALITKVAMSQDKIASSDVANTVQVWGLTSSFTEAQAMLFQTHATGVLKQLCFSPNGQYLLVATTTTDCVYRVRDGTLIGSLTFGAHERRMWRWLLLPQGQGSTDQQHFCLLVDGVIRTYESESFPQPVEGAPEAQIQCPLEHHTTPTDYVTACVGHYAPGQSVLVVEVRHHSGLVSSSTTFLYDLSGVKCPPPTIEPPPPGASVQAITLPRLCPALSKSCKHFVGFSQELVKGKCSVVFIHQNSWVCSIDLPATKLKEQTGIGHYSQHFFVPNEYLSSNPDVSPVKTADDNVVFCLHGELVSIRNGMRFQETKVLE